MVADGRLAELEGCGEIANADWLGGAGQDVHELDAHRVGQRPVYGRDCLGAVRRQGRGDRLTAAFDPVGSKHRDGYEC